MPDKTILVERDFIVGIYVNLEQRKIDHPHCSCGTSDDSSPHTFNCIRTSKKRIMVSW